MKATRHTICLRWLALVVLMLVGGCGVGAKIAAVTGRITFDGEPIETGTVRFFPVEGTPGEGAAGKVEQGRYEIALDHGLVAGRYGVVFSAVKSTGRRVRRLEVDPGEEPMIAETVQFLPERYSRPTSEQITLEGGGNEHDFHLQP